MTITRPRFGRRLAALAASGALAAGALALTAPAAQAAETTVSGATFTWTLSNEQGGGAFFGGCNFLSAGTAGDTGSSRLWTQADGFYSTQDGDVTIEKPDTTGAFAQPTWATKCQQPNGTPVSAANASTTGTRVKLSSGTGTIDAAANDADLTWDGSFTSAFYGGLTYWSATDLALTVDDGVGELTATVSGYGADMDDPSKWLPLTPETVTLATLTGVDVASTGLTDLPDYLGTTITTGEGTPQSDPSTANASYRGSFPQSFVDFQQLTGQSSYWYTSGGARDAYKPATALSVAIAAPVPTVTVDKTEIARSGSTSITVTGTGFLPSLSGAPAQPAGLTSGGVYVTLGRFADTWKPSAAAPGTARTVLKQLWALPPADRTTLGPNFTASTVDLSPEGDFTATITATKAEIDALTANPDGNLGIYTYTRKADLPSFETAEPVTIAAPVADLSVSGLPDQTAFGAARTATVSVAGVQGDPVPSGTVTAKAGTTTVGTAAVDADGNAAVELSRALIPGSKNLVFSYSGDDVYAATQETTVHQIVKANVDRYASLVPAPTSKKTGKAVVTVKGRNGGPAVKGSVKVTFSKSGSSSKILTGTLSSTTGKVTLTVPKLAKGTWKMFVKYNGNTLHNVSGTTVIKTFTVKS